MLIDVDSEATLVLRDAGYNVAEGTFGTPYEVPQGAGYMPVIVESALPNFAEREVVIIDLAIRNLLPGPQGRKVVPDEEKDWWAKCSFGVIDPRPRVMHEVRGLANRILRAGGVFVIFAARKYTQEFANARKTRYGALEVEKRIDADSWSLLDVLANVIVHDDEGLEISTEASGAPLLRLLAEHLGDARFDCSLEVYYPIRDRWETLATNKYKAPVAGLIHPDRKGESGLVIILPQVSDKAQFLLRLLNEVLPEIVPSLFPDTVGQSWVHREEYELESVIEKTHQIVEIQERARSEVAALESEIQADQAAGQFLYELLRETGSPLVLAVKRALAELGFRHVVDVDEEMKAARSANALREDLRVHDDSPVLVVDVKGVAGHPSDAEALQSQKHAFIYLQEQGRVDVRGLTIINHQRLLPPLERENRMPFRREILRNADELKLGLMTTFDLFRLVRGKALNGWSENAVKPVLYRVGRIEPVPMHYQYVGAIGQVWKNAFSLEVHEGEVRTGDRIAIDSGVDCLEQQIDSLQLNGTAVEVGEEGKEVGVSRAEGLPRLRKGLRVYRIKQE